MAAHEDIIEQLGELKPLDNGASVADLNSRIATHAKAIQHLDAKGSERLAAIERMVGEAREQIQKAKAVGSEWIPGGSVADVDRRYLLPDGSVRFRSGNVEYRLPDGSTDTTMVEGLLTDPYPATLEQREVQRAYGSYALARRMNDSGPAFASPMVRKSYARLRAALLALPGRVGEFTRTMFSDDAIFKRVVSNTAGSGGELIATPQIGEIRRPFDLARRIPGLVGVRPAPAPAFKPQIKTGRALSRLRGGTSNDPARFPVSTFTTSDTTLTIKDRVIQVLLDSQWIADAATLVPDPLGEVMDWIAMGDMDALELAFLHGDTAGTHQDTIASWTMGGYYTAGDLDGSASPLKFWIGWRARAFDDSATVAGGGAFTAATHFSALDAMGNRGANAVAITGLHCLYTQLLQYTNFLTVDKFGPQATVLTGQIGNIFGRPLIISEFVTNDLANTGLYTGSGTTTYMQYVDPSAYAHWSYDRGAEDWDVSYPERGARYVGMTRRSLLAPECISTEKPCAVIYNL